MEITLLITRRYLAPRHALSSQLQESHSCVMNLILMGSLRFEIASNLRRTVGAYSIDAYRHLKNAATVSDRRSLFKKPSLLLALKYYS